MKSQMPLASLLSQAVVALTIELDNEYEQRRASGISLISTAMYANFLRLVPDDGVPMRDLSAQAGSTEAVHLSYHGMRRWGYVTYTPDIAGSKPKKADADAIVKLTPAGRVARDQWAATFEVVEGRWGERGLGGLHRSLIPVVTSIDRSLPEYLPVHAADLRMPLIGQPLGRQPLSREPDQVGLLGLLAQALMNIAVDFDSSAMVPLCVAQNMLRPLGEEATLVRDLPTVTGVAKKAWDSGVPLGKRSGLWLVEPAATGRGKQVRLTDAGVAVRDTYPSVLSEIERGWAARCAAPLANLRAELEAFVGDGSPNAPVFQNLEPYPGCWRAELPPIRVLPHHPVVSHRGGYPDGS